MSFTYIVAFDTQFVTGYLKKKAETVNTASAFGPSVEIRLRPRPGMDADKCVAAVETGGKRC